MGEPVLVFLRSLDACLSGPRWASWPLRGGIGRPGELPTPWHPRELRRPCRWVDSLRLIVDQFIRLFLLLSLHTFPPPRGGERLVTVLDLKAGR